MKAEKNAPANAAVLVTGIGGFLTGHVVLGRGYTGERPEPD